MGGGEQPTEEGRPDDGPDEEEGSDRPLRPPRNPREYVASWSEPDSLGGEKTRAWVLILRTSGCRWAGCTMCAYHGEAAPATEADLIHQFESALGRRRGERIAKVYTSGSFLDDREVLPGTRRRMLLELSKSFERVVVETRPEFVCEETVGEALAACPGLEIAMGLESASPRVLADSVRKGFGYADFEKKARTVREHGGRVRAYLLLKPPFLNEREALEDTVSSALRAAPLCDTMSINPVNVQRGTIVEQLWRRRIYRPPWLWTAAEAVLHISRGLEGKAERTSVVCAPTGAGRRRGAHNCGRCDDGVARALEAFSLGGTAEALERAFSEGCACLGDWRDALEVGRFPFINYDGLIPR